METTTTVVAARAAPARSALELLGLSSSPATPLPGTGSSAAPHLPPFGRQRGAAEVARDLVDLAMEVPSSDASDSSDEERDAGRKLVRERKKEYDLLFPSRTRPLPARPTLEDAMRFELFMVRRPALDAKARRAKKLRRRPSPPPLRAAVRATRALAHASAASAPSLRLAARMLEGDVDEADIPALPPLPELPDRAPPRDFVSPPPAPTSPLATWAAWWAEQRAVLALYARDVPGLLAPAASVKDLVAWSAAANAHAATRWALRCAVAMEAKRGAQRAVIAISSTLRGGAAAVDASVAQHLSVEILEEAARKVPAVYNWVALRAQESLGYGLVRRDPYDRELAVVEPALYTALVLRLADPSRLAARVAQFFRDGRASLAQVHDLVASPVVWPATIAGDFPPPLKVAAVVVLAHRWARVDLFAPPSRRSIGDRLPALRRLLRDLVQGAVDMVDATFAPHILPSSRRAAAAAAASAPVPAPAVASGAGEPSPSPALSASPAAAVASPAAVSAAAPPPALPTAARAAEFSDFEEWRDTGAVTGVRDLVVHPDVAPLARSGVRGRRLAQPAAGAGVAAGSAAAAAAAAAAGTSASASTAAAPAAASPASAATDVLAVLRDLAARAVPPGAPLRGVPAGAAAAGAGAGGLGSDRPPLPPHAGDKRKAAAEADEQRLKKLSLEPRKCIACSGQFAPADPRQRRCTPCNQQRRVAGDSSGKDDVP